MSLYCGNPECGVYLGSLGAESCGLCSWEDTSDEQKEDAPSYLYCQGECGSYLGSLGAKECGVCNWNSYKENN